MAELGPYPYPSVCINCGQSSVESLIAHAARLEAALRDFVEAVPPNPDFIAEDGVRVYGLQMDELDINRARTALEGD